MSFGERQDGSAPDMIRAASQGGLPIACLPKSEALHLLSVITHGRVPVHVPFEINIDKLFHVDAHDLIWCTSAAIQMSSEIELTGVDKDHFVQIHGEQDVQKEDLVPDTSAGAVHCLNIPLTPRLSAASRSEPGASAATCKLQIRIESHTPPPSSG